MGRIERYQKTRGASAVFSERISPQDINPGLAEAVDAYAAVFNDLGKKQQIQREKETDLEATTRFYDFVKQQSALREQLKADEGSVQDTEVVRDDILNKSQNVIDTIASSISDPAVRDKFLLRAQNHLTSDSESLNIWAYAKRRENLVNDAQAEIYSLTSNAGHDPDSGDLLGSEEQFNKQVISRLDEFKNKLTDLVRPKQLENMLNDAKRQAYATHFATRLENDPEILLSQLQSGAYSDPLISQSQKLNIMKSAAVSALNAQKNALTAGTLESNYKMNKLAQGLNSGEISRSQAFAEWSFAPEGEIKDYLELALSGTLDAPGRTVNSVSAETKQFNAAKLLDEMKEIGITARPTLDKALKYKAIASKALLSLKSGEIGDDQYRSILSIANMFGKKTDKGFKNLQNTFYSSKMGEYARMISSENDPKEYVLYRMLNEVDKDAGSKRLSNTQKQIMKTQILDKVIEAFEIYAPDDAAYSELEAVMSTPEGKEKLYNRFAFSLASDKGQAVGFNIFYRAQAAARGEEYTGVIKKNGKEYKVVANSGIAQYIRIPEEDLKKLNRK